MEHDNSSQVSSVTECTVMHTTRVYQLSPRSRKQKTNPITNRELYWRDPLVGNGITQPFNWMGLTFAEQGCRSVCVSAEARLAALPMHHAPEAKSRVSCLKKIANKIKTYTLTKLTCYIYTATINTGHHICSGISTTMQPEKTSKGPTR